MSVERICGSIPTSASSTLLAEDADMGEDDYDMEGEEDLRENFCGGPEKHYMKWIYDCYYHH